jgi:hypothetical protein
MRQQILKSHLKAFHRGKERPLTLLYLFELEHFSALVIAAGLTEMMGKLGLMTLGTFRKRRKHEPYIRSSSSCL